MDFGRWIDQWIRGPDAVTPNDFPRDGLTAVLAGGLGEPVGSLSAIRAILLKQYHIPSVVGATFSLFDLPPYPYRKIAEVGKKYYNCTKRHLEAYPESSVILIGHSLGGLISLYVAHRLEREEYGDRLQKIFLLGAPLYGLDPRFLFLNSSIIRNVIQSRLDHLGREFTELTNFLLADIPLEKIVVLYSREDRLVRPEHAIVPGATNIRIHHGHVLMIASVEVARIIYKNL